MHKLTEVAQYKLREWFDKGLVYYNKPYADLINEIEKKFNDTRNKFTIHLSTMDGIRGYGFYPSDFTLIDENYSFSDTILSLKSLEDYAGGELLNVKAIEFLSHLYRNGIQVTFSKKEKGYEKDHILMAENLKASSDIELAISATDKGLKLTKYEEK